MKMAQLLHTNYLHTNCSMKCRPSLILNFSLPTALHLEKKPQLFSNRSRSFQRFPTTSFETENNGKLSDGSENIGGREEVELEGDGSSDSSSHVNDEYPSGEFVYREYDLWQNLVVKLRMLTMKLRGEISDQLKSRISSGLSLPQLCENFIKAAYDPHISGIYLHIEPLNCGWGKVEEIRRHILDFKKSGKFIVGYVPVCGEKEYYIGSACEELYASPSAYFQLYGLTVQASFLGGVLEKIGIEPKVQRIGKYKSAGDQLTRKNISDENREMLTALLDNIYGNWVEKISLAKGKQKEDIVSFINEGVYEINRLMEDGWITNIKYDDEVVSLLKQRLEIAIDKNLPTVDYRKYCSVKKWTLGLSGYKKQIAIIRATGSISRVRGSLSSSSSGIVAEQFIEKIRTVRGDRYRLHKQRTNRSTLMSMPIAGVGKGGGVLDKPVIEKTTPGRESEFDLRKSRKMSPPYRVLLHNDNFNKREYVVQVLMKVIPGMTVDNAVNIMQEAHHNGLSVVIICAQADAEEYCMQLRGNGLLSSIEPASGGC